jgi:HTH-type transcriptional regulator / antitoxin HigA
MDIKSIKSEVDYDNTIKRINQLLDLNPEPGTSEDEELDILSTLVEVYEAKHYPVEAPDPVEAMRYVMEEKGLKQKDLIPYFGSSSRVSEFFNHKAKLTIERIFILHREFKIPLEVFINEKVLAEQY